MPRRPWFDQQFLEAAETEPEAATETVIATLSGISPDVPNPRVYLEGSFTITTVAASTASVVRIRRGSTITGTLVGQPLTQVTTAGSAYALSIAAVDTPEGEFASQPYVLTVQQTAGEAGKKGKVKGAALAATY